jgi:maleate isomerase
MSGYPYKLTGPIGEKGTLGLIVLQVDETIEQDFRRIFAADGYALYVSRIPSGDELTPETIAQMGIDLPQAASLLPPAVDFDVVGYACTSGTTLIGPNKVAELIKGACRTRFTANPLNAACDALTALDVRSFGLVSPYIESVAGSMKTVFEERGFAVPASISFGEEVEARVARIDPASIRAAALEIGGKPGVEAVFLSCTNLRTLDIIDDLEADLGLPVVSSNLAMAWQMARFIGATSDLAAPGRLFRTLPTAA